MPLSPHTYGPFLDSLALALAVAPVPGASHARARDEGGAIEPLNPSSGPSEAPEGVEALYGPSLGSQWARTVPDLLQYQDCSDEGDSPGDFGSLSTLGCFLGCCYLCLNLSLLDALDYFLPQLNGGPSSEAPPGGFLSECPIHP